MDSITTLEELKILVKQFCEARDWEQFHNAKDLAIGISTEAAELLEHFLWKTETEIMEMFKNDEKKQQVAEELADTLYYILRLAERYGIDLSMEFRKKMEKNEAKYPVEKARGSNRKYTEP